MISPSLYVEEYPFFQHLILFITENDGIFKLFLKDLTISDN